MLAHACRVCLTQRLAIVRVPYVDYYVILCSFMF
jgi:hypothetical protein